MLVLPFSNGLEQWLALGIKLSFLYWSCVLYFLCFRRFQAFWSYSWTRMIAESIAKWCLSLCAVLGNIAVLVWRCRRGNSHRRSILSIMIVHLALFDFISGAYIVFFQSLEASSVSSRHSGTFSRTAHVLDTTCIYTATIFIASVYTSDWMTFSIAVYSLGTIIPWRAFVTRVIAGLAFLMAWLIFLVAALFEADLIYMGMPELVPSMFPNTSDALFCTLSESPWPNRQQIKYFFAFQCLSTGLMTIGGSVYLLAFIPRIKRWSSLHGVSEARSLVGLHGRLIAVVFVNALSTLMSLGFVVNCSRPLLEGTLILEKRCREDIFAAATTMLVPATINPFLYTVGTFRFLQVFRRLTFCLSPCKSNNGIEPREQQSLLGERDVSHICCVPCYTGNGHSESSTSDTVQSSKLFTESTGPEVKDLSFELSSAVA